MKLAILDRIGTLNMEGEDSIVALKDWTPQEGVLEAVAQLNRGGWHVALAYVVGFAVLSFSLGWHPHAAHKTADSAQVETMAPEGTPAAK